MRSCLALGIVLSLMSQAWADEAARGRDTQSRLSAIKVHAPESAAGRTDWGSRETANFRIRAAKSELERAAEVCEALRTELFQVWLGRQPGHNWEPRCEIVLHPSTASYLSNVGPAGRNSSGCSTIKSERGQIVGRRIDIRADRLDPLATALPHELTHVVLAEGFLGRDLPRWADEGIAVLADPERKQRGRYKDLQAAISEQYVFRVAELIALDDYPGERELGIFYGQSASLVDFLVARGTPFQFVKFLRQASAEGYDAALWNEYHIDGISELERLWTQSAMSHTGPQSSLRFAALAGDRQTEPTYLGQLAR